MLRTLIILLLLCLPVVFLLLTFYQVSSWKIRLFRWGVVVFVFSEAFLTKIPNHLIDKVVEYKGITFRLVTKEVGLFQSTILGRGGRARNSGYPLFSGMFPLLGEIIFDKSNVAKVVLRIPYYSVFFAASTLIVMVSFNVLSKDVNFNLFATATFTFLLTAFLRFLFLAEKTLHRTTLQKIEEYIEKELSS